MHTPPWVFHALRMFPLLPGTLTQSREHDVNDVTCCYKRSTYTCRNGSKIDVGI